MYDSAAVLVRQAYRRPWWVSAAVTLFVVALAPASFAVCGDPVAKATVRAQIEETCPCAAAVNHGDYVRCARFVIAAAVTAGTLPSECRGDVTKCVTRSTCGRGAGYVTCCRTTATGRTKCTVKSSATKCRAPSSGGSCTTGYPSCCDACTASGCAAPPTATPAVTGTVTATPPVTSTPTLTPTPQRTSTITATPTIPAICTSNVSLPPLAMVPFTIVQGSSECGGAALQNPMPAPPLSGMVLDGSATKIGDLGLGCLYAGGLAGLLIPDGATSKLNVVGLNLLPLSLTLAGSAGSGPNDCTLAAGPGRQCANGSLGIDGNGTCNSDADCGAQTGACALKPNCYFGPPIPVPDPVPACVVSAFQSDLCGRVDLVPPQATFATALSSRIYLSADPQSPCPRCENDLCNSGDRAGLACTPVGSAATSVDCPPAQANFIAALSVVVPELTTGTSTLTAGDGLFCAGQVLPGALGLSAARTVSETGAAPGQSSNTLQMNLAATFCVAPTGTFIDAVARLPGVGALTAAGQIELGNLLP